MTRQIALDTETTGLSPEQGHRVIEIACIEIVNRQITGKHFHTYLNPERSIDAGASKVHGIQDDFLTDKPIFSSISQEFLDFVKDSELIIHNAAFDVGFLNAELKRSPAVKTVKINKYCQIIDTLAMARELHPGQRNNLDALCKRYSVDNTQRDWHGALIDAELLARVYLMMTAGQNSLFTEVLSVADQQEVAFEQSIGLTHKLDLPVVRANPDEIQAHYAIMEAIGNKI
jgi:DNA polymerase-3 subunit epsilon